MKIKMYIHIAALDISTGKFETYSSDRQNIFNEIERLNPREIIYSKDNSEIFNEYFDSFLTREYEGPVKNTALAKSTIFSF